MKLALLGADPESLALAEAAVAAGHSLVWAGDLAGAIVRVAWPHRSAGVAMSEDETAHNHADADDGMAHGGPEDRAATWEDLHDGELCGAVIVGRGAADPELRLRQVQELAKQGRPMLTTFPLFESVLSYFEVDMARGEGKALVDHFNPLTAAHGNLSEAVRGGHPEFGAVQQIQCVRRMADRSRGSVVQQFARDVDFLEFVCGAINRVGAHGAAGEDAAYATLNIQLLAASGLPIRWSVEPPDGGQDFSVTLLCERGRATIECDDQLPKSAASAVRAFAASLGSVERGDAPADATSTWPQALHAMEIADSIEISLRKGRMIEIHAQQLSEQLAFKGTMAAAGCGVLLVLIPLLMIVGWIAGLAGVPVARYWPHVLLALLAGFLGLQLLSKLIYAKEKDP